MTTAEVATRTIRSLSEDELAAWLRRTVVFLCRRYWRMDPAEVESACNLAVASMWAKDAEWTPSHGPAVAGCAIMVGMTETAETGSFPSLRVMAESVRSGEDARLLLDVMNARLAAAERRYQDSASPEEYAARRAELDAELAEMRRLTDSALRGLAPMLFEPTP